MSNFIDQNKDHCHSCKNWVEPKWVRKHITDDRGYQTTIEDPHCPLCNKVLWDTLSRSLKPVSARIAEPVTAKIAEPIAMPYAGDDR